MHKFSIFTKSDKFYWSTDLIIFLIIIITSGFAFIKLVVFEIEENSFDKILIYSALTAMVCGLILKIANHNKIQPLRGKLDGFLIFDDKGIKVKEDEFPIESIRKIQISNNDYRGLFIGARSFGPALSNGTNNHILIYFTDGTNKKYYFELLNPDDFQKMRGLLIDYHCKGKIDFWELSQVLGEKNSTEIRNLKEEIERSDNFLYLNDSSNFR